MSNCQLFNTLLLNNVCLLLGNNRRTAPHRSVTAIQSKILGKSLALSFPLRMPLAKRVLGKSRSLCREIKLPYCLTQALSSSDNLELGPICSKKQSRIYLNMPNKSACSISIEQAKWIQRLLCRPNRMLYIEFFMQCWDNFLNHSTSSASVIPLISGTFLTSYLAKG